MLGRHALVAGIGLGVGRMKEWPIWTLMGHDVGTTLRMPP